MDSIQNEKYYQVVNWHYHILSIQQIPALPVKGWGEDYAGSS